MLDIENYLSVFDKFSYYNKLYGLSTLHLLTGRLLLQEKKFLSFGYRTIDPRCSIIYLKKTFTGGSSGFDFVKKVADNIGVNIYSIDDISDAGLIGTVKKEIDEETGEEDYGVVGGILGNEKIDVLYIDEASVLFQKNPAPYQQKLKNFIQKALNPLGSATSTLRKKLAHGEINITPKQSIYLVSFFPETVDETIVQTGFLKRPITNPRYTTLDDRIKNAFRDIEMLGEKLDVGDIDEVIESFNETRKFIRETEEFKIDPEIKHQLKSYTEDMAKILESTSGAMQDSGGSFLSSYQRHFSIISMHHAALRDSSIIEMQDVKYAHKEVLQPIFENIVSWLENKTEMKKMVREELSGDMSLKTLFNDMVKKTPLDGELKGYIGLSTFKEAVKKNFMKSEATSYRWINALKTKGSIEIINQGNAKFLKFKE